MVAPKRRKVKSETADAHERAKNFFDPHLKSNAWLRSYQPRRPVRSFRLKPSRPNFAYRVCRDDPLRCC